MPNGVMIVILTITGFPVGLIFPKYSELFGLIDLAMNI